MKDQAIFGRTAIAAILILFSAGFSACIHESKTVTPATLLDAYLEDPPGTPDVTAEIAYPSNGATGIPTTAKIVIFFSYPIDDASVVVGTTAFLDDLTVPGSVVINKYTNGHVLTLTPSLPLTDGHVYRVSITTGINSTATYGVRPLNQNYTWTFTASGTPVDTPPQILGRFPTGPTVPRSTNFIEVTFNEEVTNIDTSCFTINNAIPMTGVAQQGGSYTYRLNLGSILAYDTTYTINLTGAITDIDGPANALTPESWTFTTEPDPGSASPVTAISSHYVHSNITDTTARIVFVANRPVDVASAQVGISTSSTGIVLAPVTFPAAGSYITFYKDFTGLTNGTNYYYQISCTTAGGTATASGSFATAFTSTPGTVIGTPAQLAFNTLQLRPFNAGFNGTSVVAHINGADTYLSYFQADGTRLWGGGGTVVDSNTYTLPRLFRDERAGLFYTGEAGNTISMKRVYNNAGALGFYYGGSAAGAGITVDTNSTSPAVVVVHGGQGNPNMHAGEITKVTSGTATRALPTNTFFDFDVDFLGVTALTTGDHVVNLGSGRGTIVTVSANYRHALGQDDAEISDSTTTEYALGESASLGTITADNHQYENFNPVETLTYTTGGTAIYTEHATALTLPANVGPNDLVRFGLSTYGQIHRIVTMNPFGRTNYYQQRYSHPTIAPLVNRLRGNGTDWVTDGVAANYLVRNITNSGVARVTAVTATELTLTANIFGLLASPNDVNELYEIYSMYCATHPTLVDQVEPFLHISLYEPSTFTGGNSINFHDYINIPQAVPSVPLLADIAPTNPLYDNSVTQNFTSTTAPLPVANNDLVINTQDFGGNPNYGLVSTATFTIRPRALNMSSNAGINIGQSETYQILRFTNSYGIGATTLAGATSMRESGSSISFAAGNTLTSTNSDFVTQGIKAGDLVYNITTDRFATVRAVMDFNNLQLSRHIITADNQPFLVFDVQVDSPIAANTIDEPIIDGGRVTTAGNPFTDSNADFVVSAGVAVGDTLYNIDTQQSAIITAVTATTITTSPAITMNWDDAYIIMQTRIATVYQPLGGGINAKIFRLTDGSTYNTVLNLCTNTNMLRPHAASLSGGGFYTVYYNSGDGNTYGKTYNGIGTNITGGAAAADGVNLGPGETRKFESLADGSAAFMVRESGANFYFHKVNTTLGTVFNTGPIAGTQATFVLDVNATGVNTGDSFYGYINGTSIIVRKVDSTGNPVAGYPKTIDLSALDTPFIVLTAYSLSLASDGAGGVIVSWIDNRFYDSLGVGLFSVRFDSAGNLDPAYDIDSGAAEDDSGKLITIVGPPATPLTETDLNSALLFFNNGAAPFDSLHIWYDYGAPAGLYFDDFAN